VRVLLPALVAASPRTGVATYLRGLAGAWNLLDRPVPDLDLVTAEAAAYDDLESGQALRVHPLSLFPPGACGRIAALHLRIPALARRLGSDIVLSPNFISPLGGVGLPTAVVVQDLAFVHFASTIPLARRLYYGGTVRASIRHASAVLVSTRVMADEVAEFEPSVASRIRIAPLGVSSSHLATVPERTENHRGRHQGGLLCVGTLEPRKNLARVLSAHGRLCRRFSAIPPLRLVGAAGWDERAFAAALAEHPAPNRVIRLGFLPSSELAAEYRNARALIFCSLYEGFGLPVVEAMRHGCPVLCSRGTALAEVAGEAALLAAPDQVGDIEAGMLRLIEDDALVDALAAAGRERARQFTWERCARRTIDALEEVLA